VTLLAGFLGCDISTTHKEKPFSVCRCIPLRLYFDVSQSPSMNWDIEYTNEFGDWWATLSVSEQESVSASVQLLGQFGPALRFPHSSGIKGARHGNLRELRVQSAGRPFRVLYAFDPRRCALLLIGGDKTGQDRWYEMHVPIADRLYDEHIETLRREGLSDG
jgi:hypothetical protein